MGVMYVVIEVRFITLCPVLNVVICHQSSLTVSWTTKQHAPVIDDELDDEVDVEVADVVFVKRNVVAALKSVILRWTQTKILLTWSWCRGGMCTDSECRKYSY
jgi:hypothetical protein